MRRRLRTALIAAAVIGVPAVAYATYPVIDTSAFAVGRATKPKERRVLILKRDTPTGFEESAIVDVNLAPLGDALRFYRTGPEANQELDKLKQTWGNEWHRHL